MVIKKFIVKGKHKDTHRYRTERISAISEEICIQIACEKGLLEPLEITQLPAEAPTDRQLEYAKDLGIQIPPDATIYDISALISRKTDGDDSDPNPGLIEYADDRKLIFSKYIGKKAIYNLIYGSLSGEDKIAFFLFCVYRWLSDDRSGNLDKHTYRDKFYYMARMLIVDDSFIKSMNKYSGEDIRLFGEIRYQDGRTYIGGSINTIAYKKASGLICNEFNLKNKNIKNMGENGARPTISYQQTLNHNKNSGCLNMILCMLGVIFILVINICK